MEARYRYRLRVSPAQARLLQEVFDSTRFVWNHTLGRWSDLWRHEGERLSYGDASAELTDLRHTFGWLADQPHVPQQQVIRALYRAMAAFFDPKNPAGRPKFKRKGSHASAEWTKNGFALNHGRLWVATSAGRVPLRVVWSRPLPSIPKSVTVSRDPVGRFWASFVVRVEAEQLPPSGRTTGVDLGLTTFATTVDPDFDVPNPRFGRHARAQQRRADRGVSRKRNGSKNRAKAKLHRARVHAAVANRRADFVHKAARRLARSFDRIGVEDLRVKNMLANRRLSRAIADAGWAEFLQVLAWHAAKVGREVVPRDPRNTTQSCSGCGAKAKRRLGLSDRVFCCEECGLVLDRDRNAACNLDPTVAGTDAAVNQGQGVEGQKTRGPAGDLAA